MLKQTESFTVTILGKMIESPEDDLYALVDASEIVLSVDKSKIGIFFDRSFDYKITVTWAA